MLDLTSWLAVLFPLAGIDDRVEGIKRDLRDAMEECPEGEVIKLLRTITKDNKKCLSKFAGNNDGNNIANPPGGGRIVGIQPTSNWPARVLRASSMRVNARYPGQTSAPIIRRKATTVTISRRYHIL